MTLLIWYLVQKGSYLIPITVWVKINGKKRKQKQKQNPNFYTILLDQ